MSAMEPRDNRKFGLIGHPISHSLSPTLFDAGYSGRYRYDLIEGSDFEKSYKRFIDEYAGINVTAPFKELAFAKADFHSKECQMTGATNLLVKTTDGVKAYNSDFLGVRMWLEETLEKIQKTDRKAKVLIVGTGGAGKAAAAAAGSLGLDVTLMNRTISKASAVTQLMPQFKFSIRPLEEFPEAFEENHIIIYTIPATGDFNTCFPDNANLMLSEGSRGGLKFFLEANYKNPVFENRLPEGIVYTHGKTWLLYQAITGYSILTGERPNLSGLSACL